MDCANHGIRRGRHRLRLWTPQGAEIRFVKQVAPYIADLSGLRSAADALTGYYPTGAWGIENRDYHVCIDVQPSEAGQEKLAGRVNVVAPEGDHVLSLGEGRVRAAWTDDIALEGRTDRRVTPYTGQAELAEAIPRGLEGRSARRPPQPGRPSGWR